MIGGLVLALVAFAIYLATRVDRFYDHFVWQAAAFLEGTAAIRYPVADTPARLGNWFFQDVLPIVSSDGIPRGLIPFPPLPAVVLVPFVAAFGLTVDDQAIFTTLAAVDVALCWWMLGRLEVRPVVRYATTMFFAFGTAFWYTAQVATTWYQAHIVAVGLLLIAVGRALGGAMNATGADADRRSMGTPAPDDGRRRGRAVDARALLIGVLVGLATTARLPVVFGLPFFVLVGPGEPGRRARSVLIGAGIPIAVLLGWNIVSSGQPFHPAYDHLYQLEARAYPGLGYHAEWAAEDPRYLVQNLGIMFLTGPDVLPDHLRDTLGTMDRRLCSDPAATRGVFDVRCPIALPRDIGMSVLLASPAFLLIAATPSGGRRRRVVIGAALAVLLISVVNLMHFSQGWVQFGYRFSNDVLPFALVLVAVGFDRLLDGARRWAMPLSVGLIVASIVVNFWGVAWSRILGW